MKLHGRQARPHGLHHKCKRRKQMTQNTQGQHHQPTATGHRPPAIVTGSAAHARRPDWQRARSTADDFACCVPHLSRQSTKAQATLVIQKLAASGRQGVPYTMAYAQAERLDTTHVPLIDCVTPSSMASMEDRARRLLAQVGLLHGPMPARCRVSAAMACPSSPAIWPSPDTAMAHA